MDLLVASQSWNSSSTTYVLKAACLQNYWHLYTWSRVLQTLLHNLARRQQKYNGFLGIHVYTHSFSLEIFTAHNYAHVLLLQKTPVLTINPRESAWEEGNMHFIEYLYIQYAVTPLRNLGTRCIFKFVVLQYFNIWNSQNHNTGVPALCQQWQPVCVFILAIITTIPLRVVDLRVGEVPKDTCGIHRVFNLKKNTLM